MGDHRISLKIEMTLNGKKFDDIDWWLNYNPDSECPGVDQRIINFFRDAWEESLYEQYQYIYEIQEKENKRREIEHELSELKRLKEKYES